MTRCYNECSCGKVHRHKQPTDDIYHRCAEQIIVNKGLFGDTVRLCGKPATHVFWNGYWYAACDEHFNEDESLETLE